MSTALYRRYRPDTFADVIGQEHVTAPLMTALEKNRVNHAYLFSGPRGCGKTTSARILARCLNCTEGPTATPCGTCPSCRDLASGGPGSLDVIEIDAASHGGVEDARDLRERATFAPSRDRFKIFIIDEAHMVTPAGFNALLKIVEEPPAHIKFIFATTEPDKVIGTIRSRTHHYPFRLVPPEALLAYLQLLCERENVPVSDGVLPLVIRAGGGSVRDTLSVLDQLMAGAGANGVDYEMATSLLGFTHATLLDDVTEALRTADGAALFGAIDRIVQSGQDPQRFVEDLLERLRDMIIAKAVPEGLEKILRATPVDQLDILREQSAQVGSAEISRWADVTNQALSDMTGATSPRLHLELLAARLLLPAADQSERSLAARLDRLERHAMTGGGLPELGEDLAADAAASSPTAPAPGVVRKGAAAVREALAAAKAGAPDAQPAAATPQQSEAPSAPAAPQPAAPQPVASQPAAPAQEPTASADANPDPARQEPQPQQPSENSAQPDADGPLDPEANRSLNQGADADWGATWGPKDEGTPVTTPVQPGPSVPAERPDGVSPFSLVPDPDEDLSFGTGVSIDDVKQNPAMAEFARRAAANRPQSAPQQNQTSQAPQQAQSAAGMNQPQHDHAAEAQRQQQVDQQRQAEEAARREAAEREAAQRAEAQRQAEEAARRDAEQRAEAERQQQAEAQRQAEEAARREAAEREAAQRAEAQRQAEETARQEAARREAEARAEAQRQQHVEPQRQVAAPQAPNTAQPQQQGQPQQGQPQQQGQAPSGSGVQAFQQAWPSILQQLQSSSRVLHSMVANYATIAGFDGRTLTLAFNNKGPLNNLNNRPDMMQLLTNVVSQTAQRQVNIVLTEGGSAPGGGGNPKGDRRPEPARSVATAPAAPAPRGASDSAPAPSRAPEASRPAPSRPTAPATSGPYGEAPYPDEPPFDEYYDAPPAGGDPYGYPDPVAPAEQRQRPTDSVSTPRLVSKPEPAAAPAPSRAPRSFDGPPVAPKPVMTAGMAARTAEQAGRPTIERPVSATPLHPGSTTDTFAAMAVPAPEEPAPTRAPESGTPARTPEPDPQDSHDAAPRPVEQPAAPPAPESTSPEPQRDSARPAAPPKPAASGWGDPARSGLDVQPPSEPAPQAPEAGKKLSRYQQLMSQAQSPSNGGNVPAPTAGNWGAPAHTTPVPEPAPEPEDFVPSDDDIAVEDSALIGVPAIERLLEGVVIEQRDVNGNVVEINRGL
ncbi:DNA polymerase III subunit gamma and tau [Glutamicibacter endophyticus]|uniref:DNA polymerase III subunit gamma and tau n=1 Tax=Glutamicibacter endophyticus TaxID=1522174 RepID=UPI003AEF1FB1